MWRPGLNTSPASQLSGCLTFFRRSYCYFGDRLTYDGSRKSFAPFQPCHGMSHDSVEVLLYGVILDAHCQLKCSLRPGERTKSLYWR